MESSSSNTSCKTTTSSASVSSVVGIPQTATVTVSNNAATAAAPVATTATADSLTANCFEDLDQKVSNANDAQLIEWALKISVLEQKDRKNGLPLNGVSKHVLLLLKDYVSANHPDWTMAEFQAQYVKKVATQFKCSLVNLMQVVLGIQFKPATIFVSHAWQYNNERFLSCVVELKNTDDSDQFWIDALTVNQFHNQHGFEWWSTTFLRCIKRIRKTVLVVFRYSNPIPLTRAWCLFEIFCTHLANNELEIVMDEQESRSFHDALGSGSYNFNNWVANIDLAKADATNKDDKVNILKAVNTRLKGGIHDLNKVVIALLRKWLAGQVEQSNASTQTGQQQPFRVQHNHGRFFMSQGRFEEAEAVYRGLLQEKTKCPIDDDETLLAMAQLAFSLLDQGKLDEAETLYRQCVSGNLRTKGVKHLETLTAIHNLAGVLRDGGKLSEAETLFRKALVGKTATLGEEHSETLATMNQLGHVLYRRRQFEEAESLYRKTLKLEQKLLGDSHPDTLSTLNNLALLLSETGRLDEAVRMYRQQLKLMEEKLGPDNPSTLTSVNNLAFALNRQGKFEEAERMYRRALHGRQQTLGKLHPETLLTTKNLSIFLHQRGKLAGAETLFRSILECADNNAGKEVHPIVWRSMASYAGLLSDLQRFDEAIELCRKALEAQRRAFGDDHPDTKSSVEIIGWITKDAGQRGTHNS